MAHICRVSLLYKGMRRRNVCVPRLGTVLDQCVGAPIDMVQSYAGNAAEGGMQNSSCKIMAALSADCLAFRLLCRISTACKAGGFAPASLFAVGSQLDVVIRDQGFGLAMG